MRKANIERIRKLIEEMKNGMSGEAEKAMPEMPEEKKEESKSKKKKIVKEEESEE